MGFELKIIKNKEDLNFYRQKSEPITIIDSTVKSIASELLNKLYSCNAIGIAGVMFGYLKRIVIVDLQENGRKKPIIMINPEIIWKSEETISGEEASIALPKLKEMVERNKKIKVKFLGLDNQEKTIEASDLLSICIQHEIDYLDGKLFFDYLSEERRQKIEENILSTKLKVKYITRDDSVLRCKSQEVQKIDKETIEQLDQMLECMYENNGCGLASNQVGINKRIVVIDLQENEKKSPIFLINPKIVEHSKELIEGEEGCLSVPQQRANVKRYTKVKVEYLDKNGEKNIIEAENNILCVCLQHEIEHLDGILYIDHLSKLKKDLIINKVKKILKEK